MIEINLLPEEMRQTEGTPPARLAVIIVGVAIACVTGFFITKYYAVEIPRMVSEIKNRDLEIDDLKKKKAEVEKVIAEIEVLNQKVLTLDKLIMSRVRFARLLDRLCDAVNNVPANGAWFRSFNVVADTGAGGGGVPMGKRYMLNFTGYTVGVTEFDRKQRISDLMVSLNKQFRERDVDKKGINTFLNAKFDQPRLMGTNITTVPGTNETDPKILKALVVPKDGNDFVMTLSFELITNPEAAAAQ